MEDSKNTEEYVIIDGLPEGLEINSPTFEFEYDKEAEMAVYVTDDEDGEPTLMEMNQTDFNKLKSEDTRLDSYDQIRTAVSKGFDQSTQSHSEIGRADINQSLGTLASRVIQPPYPPECLDDLINNDVIASKCIEKKVRDSTGRKITIKPIGTIRPADSEEASTDNYDHGEFISQEEFDVDCKKIKDFMNGQSDFCENFQATCFKAFSDREAVGWGAIEVIRAASGAVAQINHLPASRVRRLRGGKGFVEIKGYDSLGKEQYTYYQNFGEKVIVREPDPFDPQTFDPKVPEDRKPTRKIPYDPDKHGELFIGQNKIEWDFKDRQGGATTSFQDACNEVLFLPKEHRGTKYYGISSSYPAIASMLANSFIDNHIIQYFEHNCVPRYAVSITGANADQKLIDKITKFLSSQIKGNQHKTLVFAPKSGFGSKKVEVNFIKLDADNKEQDFIRSYGANDQRIMTANGLSPALLGIVESASLGSGKGSSQQDSYKNGESLPNQLYAALEINRFFKLGLGCKYARIEYDPLDIKDAESLARIVNILLIQGIISINEARSEFGKGPIDGGDVHFLRIKERSLVKVRDIPNLEFQLSEIMGSGNEPEDSDIELVSPDASDLPAVPPETP